MIYVRNLDYPNRYLEISGHLAAALRRNELSYDQINDQAVLKQLSINASVKIDPIKVMVYKNAFVEYLDGYK